jgi:hypothetical protein
MKMKLWWYIQFMMLINALYSDFEKKNPGGVAKIFPPLPPNGWI